MWEKIIKYLISKTFAVNCYCVYVVAYKVLKCNERLLESKSLQHPNIFSLMLIKGALLYPYVVVFFFLILSLHVKYVSGILGKLSLSPVGNLAKNGNLILTNLI